MKQRVAMLRGEILRVVFFALCCLLLASSRGAMAADVASLGSGFWDDTNTWDSAGVPGVGDNVTVGSGHTVTLRDAALHTVNDLIVVGTLTHSANGSTNAYKVRMQVNGDLTVDGAIDVTAKGYAALQGPSPGAPAHSYGACHGGLPGYNGSTPVLTPHLTYGSITDPVTLGSGGAVRAGGGAVILVVSGQTTLNGTIEANGQLLIAHYNPGGAGGSVNLTTATLTGSGTISADGAEQSAAWICYGGGGGRIALKLTTGDTFGAVTMHARGGCLSYNNYTYWGAPGTVYRQSASQGAGLGDLVIDAEGYNPRYPETRTLIHGGMTGLPNGDITVRNYGRLMVSNATVSVVGQTVSVNANSTLSLTDGGQLDVTGGTLTGDGTPANAYVKLQGGVLITEPAFAYTNLNVWVASASTFDPTGLVVHANARLTVDAPHTFSNLTVQAGGVVTHSANTDTEVNKLQLTISGDLTVDGGGLIDVSAKGYAKLKGPSPAATYSGACHGGLGGYHSGVISRSPYGTYGSIINPNRCGSGGEGTAGGGVAILTVGGHTTLNGMIRSDGETGAAYYSEGAAGGSISLTTATLSGSGTNTAFGSNFTKNWNSFGGGGGRIAVKLTGGSTFDGVKMLAYGGHTQTTFYYGGAGTVYTETSAQGGDQGTVIVDSGVYAPTSPGVFTEITTNVTEDSVAHLLIRSNGELGIADGHTFGITGSFTNDTQSSSIGGAFRVGGTGTAVLGGTAATTTFGSFICTNAGKRVEFADGNTYVVTNVLTLQGATGSRIVMDSVAGAAWDLNAAPNLHSVSEVDVAHSDASGGVTIEAFDSNDGGGNVNWVFASLGATNAWNGSVSTAWAVDANWDLGRPPVNTDVVHIPTGLGNYPVMDNDKILNVLDIDGGGSLSLGGWNLTVTNHADIAGALTATASETIWFTSQADFTGGTFTPATSTIRVCGTVAQSIAFGGNGLYALIVENTSAPVQFTDNFSVTNLTNLGGTLTFAGTLDVLSTLQNTTGDIAFAGRVGVASFVNGNGNLSFADDLAATDFRCQIAGVALTFAAGKTCGITNLVLYGNQAAPITLRSATPASQWLLRVSGSYRVVSVDVQDSDASGGMTIEPVASTDSGNNPGWVFGPANWLVWDGSASTDFGAAANWTPEQAPGPAYRVLIDGVYAAAPRITASITVTQLVIGGYAPVTLTADAALDVLQDAVVLADGRLTCSANTDTLVNQIELTVGRDLSVDADAAIDATGKGYAKLKGPSPASGNIYGACHGGLSSYTTARTPYTTYGSITNPTTMGSGGTAKAGGGVVRLRVSGETSVDGTITADGELLTAYYNGAPAGGSVNLRTGSLSGSGEIRAAGSTAERNWMCYGGGGGRVAVKLTNGESFGNVSIGAWGGSHAYMVSSYWGPAGTVYLEAASEGTGDGVVIIDNEGYTTKVGAVTEMSSNMAEDTMAEIVIRNEGKLGVAAADTFMVTRSLQNDAQTEIITGTLAFGGAGTATLSGSTATTTFSNLTCTTPSKRIDFTAGNTYAVSGVLTLTGSAGHLVDLNSTAASAWNLNASPSAHTITYVDVEYSNADGGATIEAYDSNDAGNNSNWVFASGGTETNTWTGASSTAWGTDGNWDLGRAPVNTDIVLIPTGAPLYPLLDNDKILNRLDIRTGASLGLNGWDLTVTNAYAWRGALTATATETVRFEGDVDVVGGTFTAANSTVVIAGAGTQSLGLAGNALNQVVVLNTAGAVTFDDAFSAVAFTNIGGSLTFAGSLDVSSTFWNEAGPIAFDAPLDVGSFVNEDGDVSFAGLTATDFLCKQAGVTLTFVAGSTSQITNLALYGSQTDPIVLRSGSPGSAWNLDVTRWSRVVAVDVQDSDAGGGLTVYPATSTDSARNTNWDFGADTWLVWQGTLSSDFAAAGNWSPAQAPGAASRILVGGEYATAPRITVPVTVAQMMIGGYAPATLTADAVLTVQGDVTVLLDGRLTCSPNTDSPVYRLEAEVGGALTVDEGGVLDVEGKGYAALKGPAPGIAGHAYGACHGGMAGYEGTTPVATPYTTYGCITNPLTMGSGGALKAGGGVVVLRVAGMTTVDGHLNADGAPLTGYYNAGGAGGSVNLTTAELAGSGVISADGSDAVRGWMCYGGAGGRVALRLTSGSSLDGVTVRTRGGSVLPSNYTYYAAPGTVYCELPGQGPGDGELIVDASGYVPRYADTFTLISSNTTGAVVGDVTIRNAARFELESNQTLTVRGDWTRDASFVAQPGSTVVFAGTGSATIGNDNTFHHLSTATSWKTLRFEAGCTNTVNGTLDLSRAILESTLPGQAWGLTLSPGGTQTLSRLRVQDSDASGGQTLHAGAGSADFGNNINWTFPARGSVFSVR